MSVVGSRWLEVGIGLLDIQCGYRESSKKDRFPVHSQMFAFPAVESAFKFPMCFSHLFHIVTDSSPKNGYVVCFPRDGHWPLPACLSMLYISSVFS